MHAKETPLNPQVVKRIQNWLRMPEATEFCKLIGTLSTKEKLDSLEHLHESEGEDGHREDAFAHMQMAKNYELMLHCIESILLGHAPDAPEQKFPFITLEITPTSTPIETILES